MCLLSGSMRDLSSYTECRNSLRLRLETDLGFQKALESSMAVGSQLQLLSLSCYQQVAFLTKESVIKFKFPGRNVIGLAYPFDSGYKLRVITILRDRPFLPRSVFTLVDRVKNRDIRPTAHLAETIL